MKNKLIGILSILLLGVVFSCNNQEIQPKQPIVYTSSNGEWLSTVDKLKVSYTEVTLQGCNLNVCQPEQWSTDSKIEYNGLVFGPSQDVKITNTNGYIIQVYCTTASVIFYNCRINNTFTEIIAEYAVLQGSVFLPSLRFENPIIKRIK